MLFSLILPNNEGVVAYMEETNKRLQGNDFSKNPFRGEIRSFDFTDEIMGYKLYMCKMKAIYPDVTFIGYIPLAISVWLHTIGWYTWVGIIIAALGFFWTKYFLMLMLRLGLRKHGYIGKVKYISSDVVIDKLAFQ